MKVLIVGGGGREHALAWKAAQSSRVESVYLAPGNAGTAVEPKVSNIDIGAEDIVGLLAFAKERAVGLTIVGPEAPLVAGIADQFAAAGLRIFGPSKAAAQLEGSKAFSKEFLARHRIPTAAYATFTDIEAARAYIRERGTPIVVKADGLAAGKGVIIARREHEALTAVEDMLAGNAFGAAGHRVVLESFLEGEEASFIVMVGQGRILPLASSQDHKARDEGDTGPNTGGMGAYSPAPVVTPEVHARIMADVIEPTVRGMQEEGIPYTGFLYAGIMVGDDGSPEVLEFNCRLGDPETQPIMMRLSSDLTALCDAALDGTLPDVAVEWDRRAALGVVLAAGGYPGSYSMGDTITGLEDSRPDTKVFHAGTTRENDRVVTAGGRVLCVCALGATVAHAQRAAYDRARAIHWRDVYFRGDIGYRAIQREKMSE